MQSNRRGQAQSALSAVQGRHEAIQKIERQMIELAQLFQDVDAAIVEQEAPVQAIETGVEKTHENIQGGNKQLDGAIKKAKSIRRKKWICFGIVIAIIVIIVVIILILKVRLASDMKDIEPHSSNVHKVRSQGLLTICVS